MPAMMVSAWPLLTICMASVRALSLPSRRMASQRPSASARLAAALMTSLLPSGKTILRGWFGLVGFEWFFFVWFFM